MYTVGKISELVGDVYELFDKHKYAELTDWTVSRLTLFKARRSGEPARMLMSEWIDAETNVWLRDNQPVSDSVETNMFHGLKIAYQSGKGNNHLVPVLIPQDTVRAMQILSEQSVRDTAGIFSSNTYMFPATKSDSHVSGWHAVNRVCCDAGVDRMLFYKHHDKKRRPTMLSYWYSHHTAPTDSSRSICHSLSLNSYYNSEVVSW